MPRAVNAVAGPGSASPTTPVLAPGEVLGGFRVVEAIGIGGMAIVYRAEQLSLRRQVALKVLSPQFTTDEGFRERFRREGQHVAGLDHPHIVTVYESGEDEGYLFLAMRLIDCVTLAELIQDRSLTPTSTIEILRPIADALDVAHAAGLVHRDVKPHNILVGRGGHPYLADFGIAKSSSSHGFTAAGGFFGSIHYASPEQIRGRPANGATDLYALTAVLYHCLAGSVPYPRDNDASVVLAHLHRAPPRLPPDRSDAARLDPVIARGMAKSPDARYATGADLIAAAAVALGQPPVARQRPTQAPSTAHNVGGRAASGHGVQPRPAGLAAIHPATGGTMPHRRRLAAALTPRGGRSRTRGRVLAGLAVCLVAAGGTLAAELPKSRPHTSTRREPVGRRPGAEPHATTHSRSAGGTPTPRPKATPCASPSVCTVSRGGLSFHYQAPLKPATRAAIEGYALPMTDTIVLTMPGATMQAGLLRRSSLIPAGPPPQLVSRLGAPARPTPSQPRTVTIGSVVAQRYYWRTRSQLLMVLSIATQTGDRAVVCDARSAGALGTCAAAARRVQLDVRTVPPGVPSQLGPRIASRLQPAVAARATLSNLRGPSTRKLVATERAAASADDDVADSLNRLVVWPRFREQVRGLVRGLHAEAHAIEYLATSASRGDRQRYDEGREHERAASEALERALDALGRLGLHPPELRSPVIPQLATPVRPQAPRYVPPGQSAAGTPTVSVASTATLQTATVTPRPQVQTSQVVTHPTTSAASDGPTVTATATSTLASTVTQIANAPPAGATAQSTTVTSTTTTPPP